MKVYLVRHGEAMSGEQDAQRGLTEAGMSHVAAVAGFLAHYGACRPARIVHSGKKRARQTAALLAERLSGREAEAVTDLDPMADPGAWAEHLAGLHDDVMLVGHLPHMARLASLLLVGTPDADIVRFVAAGAVCLERDQTGWSLSWMLTPELLC